MNKKANSDISYNRTRVSGSLPCLHDDHRLPAAWGPWFSHEYINYGTATSIKAIMDLPPVPVKPNPRRAGDPWLQGPRHRDLYKERFQETRRLDPLQSFDYHERNGEYAPDAPLEATVEPWKILVIYCTEPDLLLDYDLALHRLQRFTGGSHGWRHMHFRLPGVTIGIAPETFRVHRDLAIHALRSGNDYWGWRYLSRATHYLADLGNPFHVKAAPAAVLLREIRSFRKALKTISTGHQGFEIYTERRFREGFRPFSEALSHGAFEGFRDGDRVDRRMEDYIMRARKRLKGIFNFIMDTFGVELREVFEQMDRYRHLDVASQTNRCSADAARVIFPESGGPALDYLDRITEYILFDVGWMLGMAYAGFYPFIEKKK